MLNINQITKNFETVIDDKLVSIHFLQNNKGTKVGICNYGARITHFLFDKNEHAIDIVLGCDRIEDYLSSDEKYIGVTVGRFANRIANGKFTLNHKEFSVTQNNGTNCLHAGNQAFHNKVWDILEATENAISLEIISPNMEEGFPGELTCKVTFILTDENELKIKYWAQSTRNTVINLTNHAYFNLNGEHTNDIVNHKIKINANYFIPVNENCIPLGHYQSVENTPFNLRNFTPIKEGLASKDLQIKIGNGYDHSFVVNKHDTQELLHVATAMGDLTEIKLDVYTTEPGLQFYTGNYLEQIDKGKKGKYYKQRAGFCLETQHHPNSPNQENFPTTILKTGELFSSETIFKVS